jgi:hypothetical protein
MVEKSITKKWTEIRDYLICFFQWGLECIIDALFLSGWVCLQWFVKTKVFDVYVLDGIDSWVPIAIQVIFAISTILPILLLFYRDIRIMLIRVNESIFEAQVKKED